VHVVQVGNLHHMHRSQNFTRLVIPRDFHQLPPSQRNFRRRRAGVAKMEMRRRNNQREKLMRERKRFSIALAERLSRLWLLAILIGFCWSGAGQAQTPKTQTVKTDVTEGFILVGDIQLPAETALAPSAAYAPRFWTDGDLPFVFDANVSEDNQDAMRAAMAEWENVAGVHFRTALDSDVNHVHIQNSNGNNSAIGMVGGKQIINIVSWNNKGILMHELGHCLGLWHEQTRPDRDAYVEILDANIQEGKAHNFALNQNAGTYGAYDFDSIMHYNKCTFSTGCPAGQTCKCAPGTETILVREPYRGEWQNKIGQRTHLSSQDRAAVRSFYPVFVDASHDGGEKGTFKQPFKGFRAGADAVAPGGTLIVRPGSYAAAGSYDKPMTIKAPQGEVTLEKP
jgi:Astacin (Peptidase family M12A)